MRKRIKNRNSSTSRSRLEIIRISEVSQSVTSVRSVSQQKEKMFDESCDDESVGLSGEDVLKITLFEIVDNILGELKTRFQHLEDISEKFGFLNGSNIFKMNVKDLHTPAKKLAETYKDDINEYEFLEEIESCKHHALVLDANMKTAPPARHLHLIYKHRLDEGYPNMTTALKIFVTLPVTVVSDERSFSKLKLVKNYLRSTMAQESLSNLSIIAIEHKRASNISYDNTIKIFACKIPRRLKLVI